MVVKEIDFEDVDRIHLAQDAEQLSSLVNA
jgi:hypothetical protein